MSVIHLYSVSDEYINFLKGYDRMVYSNKENVRVNGRKYLGAVLRINEFNYFVPLSSPKKTDYIIQSGEKLIRKSIIPIIRIISKDRFGNDELKGTLRFSNMIPVPNCALEKYNIQAEQDKNYKLLVLKELSFIHNNTKIITKHAQIIYNQKIKDYKIPYLKHTVNFLLLEEKCKEFANIKQELINSTQQIAATNINDNYNLKSHFNHS